MRRLVVAALLLSSAVVTHGWELPAYELTVTGGSSAGLLDEKGRAVYAFAIKARRDISSTGVICLASTVAWEWSSRPQWNSSPGGVTELALNQQLAVKQGVVQSKAAFAGSRDVRFFVAMGNSCPGAPGVDSNLVTKSLAYSAATPVTTAPTGMIVRDLIEVTNLAVTVNQPDRGQVATAPKAGQPTTVRLTVRNHTNGALTIPWQIKKNGQLLGSASALVVSANGSATVTAPWLATAGDHRFTGSVDAANTLREQSTMRLDNDRSLDIAVVGPLMVPMATYATQTLDYQKAKDAGATFDYGPRTRPGPFAGVLEPRFCGGSGHPELNTPDLAVVFEASSNVQVVGAPGPGAKGEPEAFKTFTLKNGWTVKSVVPITTYNADGNGGWRWVTQPVVGSANPLMKVSIWVDAFGTVNANRPGLTFGSIRTERVCVTVLIEGPAGTNPYR